MIMATSTSFRISDAARTQLATRAAREGMTATALLDLLIVEGIDQLDYSGIIFRGPAHDRRAALAAGPDVWEVIARLQELDGREEQRISLPSAESDLHPRLIRIALDYAAEHLNEVQGRIDRNQAMAERNRTTTLRREALLAGAGIRIGSFLTCRWRWARFRAGFADRRSRRSLVDPWVSVGRVGSDSGYGDVSVPGHQAHVARVAGDDGDLGGRR